jgi:hypothetical protein
MQAGCDGAVIPALGRLRQEAHKFEVSLAYLMSPCLKKNKNKLYAHMNNKTIKNKISLRRKKMCRNTFRSVFFVSSNFWHC